MAVPKSTDARLFYRCAGQRYEDAQVLLKANHTTGAVYLAGYGIECILKALALTAVSESRQSEMVNSFRGRKAHDYEWLRDLYVANGGARFPGEINRQFVLVNDWSTDLRYVPRNFQLREAVAFLDATAKIISWARERLN